MKEENFKQEDSTIKRVFIKETTLLTIAECQQIIRQLDPSTRITNYFIRKCAERGLKNEIPVKVITAGKKKLVNFASLLNYLQMELTEREFILTKKFEDNKSSQITENNNTITLNEDVDDPSLIQATSEEIMAQNILTPDTNVSIEEQTKDIHRTPTSSLW